ncbi:MAG TPA: hypothetical protein VG500_06855 [Gemmatimonadales bacterium]|jgi:hypothetical protein|nr:hypothetical protein [Gemmatimonadales bacterium]
MRTLVLLGYAWALLLVVPACAQGQGALDPLPPPGFGSLKQSDLALLVRSDELEVRLVPLDERVTRLLARDAYQSLQGLVHSRRVSIDSVARIYGISAPGLALVTFFGGREGARFDPSTLTLGIRNRVLRPRGVVPLTPRFTSQQLNVREQVSAIFLFDELLPVTDDFNFSFQGRNSESWQNKQRMLDRERGRVAARSRVTRPDSGVAAEP